MKAARFYEPGKIVVEEVETPQLLPDEVLIKVHYCGICGTDVHIFNGDEGSSKVSDKAILGHEFSGEIVKIGSDQNNYKNFKVGDLVCCDVNYSCGHCHYCNNGKPHLCDSMKGIGTAINGAFAEYIAMPQDKTFLIPEHLSLQEAAMTEPVSCCLHGIDLINISLGETVLIVGCGNIGLTMIQLCKYAGASNIIAVEPISHRRDLALQLGADYVFDSNNASVLSNVDLNQTGPITKAIDCAGLISTAEFCIENAGKGATVLLFGLTGPHDVLSVKPFSMFLKELTIKTSFVNPFTFERALNLLSNGIVKTSEIITDIYPLADIQEVFANRLYAKNGKVLIKCVSE